VGLATKEGWLGDRKARPNRHIRNTSKGIEEKQGRRRKEKGRECRRGRRGLKRKDCYCDEVGGVTHVCIESKRMVAEGRERKMKKAAGRKYTGQQEKSN